VYDRSGDQPGSRVGREGATANELDAAVPWTCVATIDMRRWPTMVTHPPHGTYGAGNVIIDWAKNNNLLVTKTCDNDILGRTTGCTNAWGKTTNTTYDQANRPIQSVSVVGSFVNEYTAEGQLCKVKLDGTALATLAYNTSGELQSISCSKETSVANLDTAGRRFTRGRMPGWTSTSIAPAEE
jgi:YD repeat-containing protein